jgi:hypothetical protein
MILKNTMDSQNLKPYKKKIQYVKIQPFDGKTWSFKNFNLVWENSTHMMQYFKSDSVNWPSCWKVIPTWWMGDKWVKISTSFGLMGKEPSLFIFDVYFSQML